MIRFLRNVFFRNWGLKIFSFLLALVLWLTLIPEEKEYSEKTVAVLLEVSNVPRDLELVERPTARIDVTVRAPLRLLSQISASNVTAMLNLEKGNTYQEEYPLNNSMVTVPPGAEVVRIAPNKVNIKLERTKQALMDVVPNLIGKLQEGYRIEKIDVNPSRVEVKGPESQIKAKDKVRTSPVDISNLTQTADLEADLILPKPDLRLASSNTTAKITIVIAQASVESNRTGQKKKQNP
jgi:YbbR domain-containing protein